MPYVSHDATPDLAFECAGFRAPWNGWAVPFWLSPDGLAGAMEGVLGDDASVTVVGGAVVVARAGEPDEVVVRDAFGAFVADGWTWVPAHRHGWLADVSDWWCADCEAVTDFCSQARP